MDLRILHIGPDSQFIQFLSGVFEAVAPGASRYLITGTSTAGEPRFPVHSKAACIYVSGVRGVAAIPLHIHRCDMIIAHGMSPQGMVAFLASPKSVIRIWSGWGFDYYGSNDDPEAGLISIATKNLLDSQGLIARSRYSMLKRLLGKAHAYAATKAAERTDFFSAPIPADFEVFKQRFLGFRGAYAQLNYGSVAETFAKGACKECGVNVLVGNSALKTNNHIDVFQALAKHDLASRKVIVPLSYGDSAYRDSIIAAGREILGDAFIPLTEFLPPEQYGSILASCNVVVMNHVRQQALANIGAALYQGAHVFLHPKSPVYGFFREKGAFVRSVAELISHPLPVNGLTDAQVEKNRSVLEGFWGDEKIRSNVEALLIKAAEKRKSL